MGPELQAQLDGSTVAVTEKGGKDAPGPSNSLDLEFSACYYQDLPASTPAADVLVFFNSGVGFQSEQGSQEWEVCTRRAAWYGLLLLMFYLMCVENVCRVSKAARNGRHVHAARHGWEYALVDLSCCMAVPLRRMHRSLHTHDLLIYSSRRRSMRPWRQGSLSCSPPSAPKMVRGTGTTWRCLSYARPPTIAHRAVRVVSRCPAFFEALPVEYERLLDLEENPFMNMKKASTPPHRKTSARSPLVSTCTFGHPRTPLETTIAT